MVWRPCRCGNFWCTEHEQHAHDCPCPAIEEMDTDPYQDEPEPADHAGSAT